MNEPFSILIIDDNAHDVFLTRSAIVDAGHLCSIEPFFNAQRALERLAEPPQPALVFLDVKMPGMDGLEILRRLRGQEATRFVPVIMLSTSNLATDIKASYEGGANSFLHKAHDLKKFTEEIQAAIRFWLEHNLLP